MLSVLRGVTFSPDSCASLKCDVWAAGKGHEPRSLGHTVELCPQTNLMVGVYLAAALFFKQL